ncbi:MAG TPA: hypothetical protein PK280_20925 [Planctomycetota bacterium]|nr:hypothetical protein [Planctomycetota bacterium]
MPAKRSWFQYVKTAFLWRWNLLLVGAGAVLAVLSGKPDVVLPVLGALEVGYLGLMTTNARFQKAVDAAGLAAGRTAAVAEDPAAVLGRIRGVLTPKEWGRFESLRRRCEALDEIGRQLRGPDSGGDGTLTGIRSEALDRLLWMFLKLLISKNALDRFLDTVDPEELSAAVAECEKQVESARGRGAAGEHLVRSLEDKLETIRQRLTNRQRAKDNRETVVAELDRVEQKIAAVSEGTLTSRDAAAIGAQVDGIAAGVTVADEAIRDLDVSLPVSSDSAPNILRRKVEA